MIQVLLVDEEGKSVGGDILAFSREPRPSEVIVFSDGKFEVVPNVAVEHVKRCLGGYPPRWEIIPRITVRKVVSLANQGPDKSSAPAAAEVDLLETKPPALEVTTNDLEGATKTERTANRAERRRQQRQGGVR